MKDIQYLNRKEKNTLRNPILKDLKVLEKKYGLSNLRYTLNWYVLFLRETESKKKKIKQLKQELNKLEKTR